MSTSARVKPSRVAIRSAEMPCGTMNRRWRSFSLFASRNCDVRAHRHARHRLDTAADAAVEEAGADLRGDAVDRLETRAAEPVDGVAGDVLRPVRGDQRVRAMHAPCSLTCVTQPIETSWTRFLSSLRRSAIVFRVCASSSCGWMHREPALAGLAATARRTKCVVNEHVSHRTTPGLDARRMVRNQAVVKGYCSNGQPAATACCSSVSRDFVQTSVILAWASGGR